MKITEAVISGNAVNAEASEYIRRIYSCDMIGKSRLRRIFSHENMKICDEAALFFELHYFFMKASFSQESEASSGLI